MAIRTDIAIIGGGAVGLSIGWRLAQGGASVALIDARSAAPRATRAAAGMLAPSFEGGGRHAPGAPFSEFAAMSRSALAAWQRFAPALEAAAGVEIDYRADGILGVAMTEDEAADIDHQARAMAAAGVPAIGLDARAVRELEPLLGERVVGGLFAAGEGQVDPVRLLEALEIAALRAGAQVAPGVVVAIDARRDAVSLRLASGRVVEAARVVVATGAGAFFSRAVTSPTGNPLVVPVKGEAFALAPANAAGAPRRVVRSASAYVCPKADGRVVVGATELRGAGDLAPSTERVAALRAAAERLFPTFSAATETARWAGLRPGTPDGAPVIGPSSRGDSRIVLALGHYRNGVLLAPATADLVAANILATRPEWPSAFSADRFAAQGRAADDGGR